MKIHQEKQKKQNYSKKGDTMSLVDIRSATITDKGQIAIPREMRQIKGFKTGSKIAIIAFQDHVELRPLSELEEKFRCYNLSKKSLSKDWLSKEDEKAWKNL